MTTQLSTINAYTNTVWTPPRICGIPALLMAPFRDYRWFLPRISVVDPADDFDDSDDSENEETPLSCHSLGWTASERPCVVSQNNVNGLEIDTKVVNKKHTDSTGETWDYYLAPLSPLSELTESEDSDSDEDVQKKPTKNVEAPEVPLVAPQLGIETRSTNNFPTRSASSNSLKRKRSCELETSPTLDVNDPETPSKRRRHMSGMSEGPKVEKPATAPHPLRMTRREVRRSIRRHAKTFGRIRKPKAMPTADDASIERREMELGS